MDYKPILGGATTSEQERTGEAKTVDEKPVDETDFGAEKAPQDTGSFKLKLKKHKPEQLEQRIAELQQQVAKFRAAQEKMSTTYFRNTTLNALDKIRRNLDIYVLGIHTIFSLVAGAILGVGFYLENGWVQSAGGGSLLIVALTFAIKTVMPQSDVAKLLDSPNLVQHLGKMTTEDIQKLIEKISETAFSRGEGK